MSEEEKDKVWDFDDEADGYDDLVASNDPVYERYDDVLHAVVDVAAVCPGMKVLDLGCGTGNLTRLCLERGPSLVAGLDPSARMLEKARAKMGSDPRVQFRQVADPFGSIPYDDGAFDVVVSSYAYHHVAHRLRRGTVAEMMRVLRPGGIWALGDLVFESEEAEQAFLAEFDFMEEEYFPRLDHMQSIFRDLGIELNAMQFTRITWLLWAMKP
jgi:ubiquinone/menaquinone biosynthesis C-methylase UbiE